MANAFDQFDAPGAEAAGNPFDQFDAPAPSAVAPSPSAGSGIVPTIVGAERAVNEGIPFSDRIVAAAKSLPYIGNNQSYADNLAQEQAARAQLSQAHPLATALGRGVGGVLTGAALPGASVAEAGLAPALEAGARTGAAYGAAQGVSDQPDLNNLSGDIGGAIKGAAEGGSLGTVFSGLGYGAGKGGSALVDQFSRPSADTPAGAIANNPGAASKLADAYAADRARLETTPAGVNDSGDKTFGVPGLPTAARRACCSTTALRCRTSPSKSPRRHKGRPFRHRPRTGTITSTGLFRMPYRRQSARIKAPILSRSAFAPTRLKRAPCCPAYSRARAR